MTYKLLRGLIFWMLKIYFIDDGTPRKFYYQNPKCRVQHQYPNKPLKIPYLKYTHKLLSQWQKVIKIMRQILHRTNIYCYWIIKQNGGWFKFLAKSQEDNGWCWYIESSNSACEYGGKRKSKRVKVRDEVMGSMHIE